MDKYLETLSAVPLVDVLLAAAAMLLLSMVWYGWLFRRTCLRLDGRSAPGCLSGHKPSAATIAKGFAAFLATCYLIGLIDVHAQGHPVAIFASVALVWLFCALDTIHATIWGGMPFRLFLIHIGNTLAGFLLAGLVFWGL